ncbi:RING-H2 finger protein ATL16-like [Durio zibethinus]|uniref:RING-type E3 ubiquitin transferase n=1 Tax=Durio zibethinus TaxID=66656 RepID=A0A6P5Z993_DURZI|nr:RING-H2 finger protein ATL16-like [Durio zibethinus]
MDLVSKSYTNTIRLSQALSPITSPGKSILGPYLHSSDTSFPIIAIAVVGILATAFLLLSYYIFVIKCCFNWHRIDLLRRFFLSRRLPEDPLMASSPAMEQRGLDESVIRSIPIFQFKKGGNSRDFGERSFCECAVCLNEFQEDEKLRIIPNCSHVFHIDCIDVWLHNNANCPLCRTSISSSSRFPVDQINAPRSTPQDPNPYTENIISDDEDFVVIELDNHSSTDQILLGAEERLNSGELWTQSISPSPRKLEQRIMQKKARKLHKGTSMGDECIDIRDKDEQLAIQPIRRSISMDSSADLQLYLAVQEAVRQSRQVTEVSPSEGCSSRVRRPFFSFVHGKGSKSAVLPVYLEP